MNQLNLSCNAVLAVALHIYCLNWLSMSRLFLPYSAIDVNYSGDEKSCILIPPCAAKVRCSLSWHKKV